MPFKNKTILITGGTGSLGTKLTEIILKEYSPKTIRIFSRGELLQSQMQAKFADERLRFFIGDVRDKRRLHRALNGVDIVIHAAALKHVPICEYNPIEAVKTNINGSTNVIDCAINNGVKKVILTSTDKAVYPVNLYGATKLVAEKPFVQGNNYSKNHKTIFSCVRYGNVMGSRGSVIPIFQKQSKLGKVSITDDTMTRFWITQRQAVDFIIDCIKKMRGGEIFIPKIPSMKIIDLAKIIALKCKIEIIGIRPGEKIHETLLTEEEARHSKEFFRYFIIEPEFKFWDRNNSGGEILPDDFKYSSDKNHLWLTKKELKKILEERR